MPPRGKKSISKKKKKDDWPREEEDTGNSSPTRISDEMVSLKILLFFSISAFVCQ
jgi:hypothetical protein